MNPISLPIVVVEILYTFAYYNLLPPSNLLNLSGLLIRHISCDIISTIQPFYGYCKGDREMRILHARVAVLLLALSLVPISAGASIITFEGVAAAGAVVRLASYEEQGYRITLFSPPNDVLIIDSGVESVVNNGTDIFGWCLGSITSPGCDAVRLERIDGARFNLNSFDATNLLHNTTTEEIQLIIEGWLEVGVLVGDRGVTLGVDEWRTFDIPHPVLFEPQPRLSFTDMDFVRFFVRFNNLPDIPNEDAFGFGRYGVAFDNIDVSLFDTSVPEPTSLALMSLGLLGLGFNRRKRLQ